MRLVEAGLAVLIMSASVRAEVALPAFEVATIKPGLAEGGNNIGVSEGILTMRNVTLNICLKWAYGAQDSQIVGTSLTNSERYDIAAKAPGQASVDTMKLMLQSLLADRFKLALHREMREQNTYELVVGKGGPKLHQSAGQGVSSQRGKGTMVAQWTTMAQFANFLSGPLQSRVADATGLPGQFDFTLDLTPYLDPGQQPDLVGAVITGLQEQLGLKLETRKLPVEVLVIDHAEKPSPN